MRKARSPSTVLLCPAQSKVTVNGSAVSCPKQGHRQRFCCALDAACALNGMCASPCVSRATLPTLPLAAADKATKHPLKGRELFNNSYMHTLHYKWDRHAAISTQATLSLYTSLHCVPMCGIGQLFCNCRLNRCHIQHTAAAGPCCACHIAPHKHGLANNSATYEDKSIH